MAKVDLQSDLTNAPATSRFADFRSRIFTGIEEVPRNSVPLARVLLATLITLLGAALLEWSLYGHGGHDALSDLPGRYFAWHLSPSAFPFINRPVEYPVVIGYVAWVWASLLHSCTQFFVANSIVAVAVILTISALLRARGAGRIWRWAFAPMLFIFAFHNWDALALLPAIFGLLAAEAGMDATAGVALAIGASIKLFPGLFLPPLLIQRWLAGDRRGALRMLIGAAITTLLINLPVALRTPSGWAFAAKFQGRRSATWGSIWYWIFRTPGISNFVARNPSHVANLAAAAALLITLVAISVLAVRRNLSVVEIGAAVLASFILANKVYSPNYDLWIVPFFVLLPIARRHWITFCVGDIGVSLLVFGRFHGLWGTHVVLSFLWIFVGLRVIALLGLIAFSLKRRDSEAPIQQSELTSQQL